MRRAIPLISAAGLLALAGCGGGDGGDSATTTASGAAGPAGCKQVTQPPTRPSGGARAPRAALNPQQRYQATIATNCGRFTIVLDQRSAPHAAASFVALARSRFYAGTVFHRIVPGFVIQGGDPTAGGNGGPGYKTVDRPPRGTRYTLGAVAMAKGGSEAAGTAGSQFFVVTGPDARLPAKYALLGKVTEGLDVAQRIGMLGDPATERPTAIVAIDSVEVSSR